MLILSYRASGGTGRRTGLKILRASNPVPVQVRPRAPFIKILGLPSFFMHKNPLFARYYNKGFFYYARYTNNNKNNEEDIDVCKRSLE